MFFLLFTETRSFKLFLQQHIDLAFTRGFDDNVGRHSTPAHFEVFFFYNQKINLLSFEIHLFICRSQQYLYFVK